LRCSKKKHRDRERQGHHGDDVGQQFPGFQQHIDTLAPRLAEQARIILAQIGLGLCLAVAGDQRNATV